MRSVKLTSTFKKLLCSVISQCIQLLVADLEAACEPALITMAKVSDVRSHTLIGVSDSLNHLPNFFPNRRHGRRGRASEISHNTLL
jgi:hypothetical protein